mgnify:CR=1 FL=1
MVVGCGTGIEGCGAVQASVEERNQCESDPRRSWRSHLVALSGEGDVLWSRTESFVDTRGEAHETASEFVMTGQDGSLYSVVVKVLKPTMKRASSGKRSQGYHKTAFSIKD